MQIVNCKTPFSKQTRSLILWKKWVIANAVAESLSLGMIALVQTTSSMIESANMQGVLVLLSIFKGGLLGFAQWLVLRHYIHNSTWWIFVTTVGGLFGWLILLFVSVVTALPIAFEANGFTGTALLMGVALLGGGVGTVMGLAQGLVLLTCLRVSIQKAVWWINANALAGALYFLIMFVEIGIVKAEKLSAETVLVTAAMGAITGVIAGVITGAVLVYLSIKTVQPQKSQFMYKCSSPNESKNRFGCRGLAIFNRNLNI